MRGVVPAAGGVLAAVLYAGEYEPLPASIFVIPFGVPAFATAVVLGVAARRRVTAHRHR